MRRSIAWIVPLLMLLSHGFTLAQDHAFSLTLRGGYTTTSKIYSNPDAADPELAGQYSGIDNIYAPGLELRWTLPGQSIALTLEVERIAKSQEDIELVGFTNPPSALPIKEGLRLYSLELGGLLFIPLGSDQVRLTMGGGLGMYIGERSVTIAGVEATQQNSPISVGIHVETSFDYRITQNVFARLDMRFRDPEYTAESRFLRPATQYGGQLVLLPEQTFRAKVNVNGLNFGLGIGVELF
ncbi:MAG TPA: hypothetical protein VMH23_03430 [Bacteroidota bacterium]|nr:hypothetical protein [Bacteroidota bacterium]